MLATHEPIPVRHAGCVRAVKQPLHGQKQGLGRDQLACTGLVGLLGRTMMRGEEGGRAVLREHNEGKGGSRSAASLASCQATWKCSSTEHGQGCAL